MLRLGDDGAPWGRLGAAKGGHRAREQCGCAGIAPIAAFAGPLLSKLRLDIDRQIVPCLDLTVLAHHHGIAQCAKIHGDGRCDGN